MNNLYHKVAVVSVCTILGFGLGANKEVKAATFTLRLTSSADSDGISFSIRDSNPQDGLGDFVNSSVFFPVGTLYGAAGYQVEYKAFYEFNIAKLSLASNTVISSAIFQGISDRGVGAGRFPIVLFGYIGNGQADLSDFQSETYLNNNTPKADSLAFSYDVTSIIQQIISNNNDFVGIGFRRSYIPNQTFYTELDSRVASLTITTVDVAEPVPEPTTILTAAVALGWGGWLKRKNSSQHDKTK